MHCINVSGEVDANSFQLYRGAKQRKRLYNHEAMVEACVALANKELSVNPTTIRKRSCQRKRLLVSRNEEGGLVEVTPRMTNWLTTYVDAPDVESVKFIEKFCLWFCCKYDGFKALLHMIKESPLFNSLKGMDATGKLASLLNQQEAMQ
jgi:hypothetical protein